MLLSYLRTGQSDHHTDNHGMGGIVAPINTEGVLGMGNEGSIFTRRRDPHPRGGQVYEGRTVPCLAEAEALAL